MTAQVSTAYLSTILNSARQRTLELLEGLSNQQLVGPKLPIVNPILWEIGHVAWFYEFFILRQEYGHDPLLERGDQLYDSIAVHHSTRWDVPIYDLGQIKDYMKRVLDLLVGRLDGSFASKRDSYLYLFTVFHEDMHDEAFTWSRQTLSYPSPAFRHDNQGFKHCSITGPLDGDSVIPGGTFCMGSEPSDPFVFDNEKWGHEVTVGPFVMSRTPVTCFEFLQFVEEGGYENDDLWTTQGLVWRNKAAAHHPIYWKRDKSGGWRVRRFDCWDDFYPNKPVDHVNWYEAVSYCRWAGRRLPTEVEWEFAATMRSDDHGTLTRSPFPWGEEEPDAERVNMDGFSLGCVDVASHPTGENVWGCRQLIGNVWEWTADTFKPFAGFSPDDYKEYSEPLFGTTKVLRGGSWATRSRYINSRYRNFFGPERRDIFAGFRTCKNSV